MITLTENAIKELKKAAEEGKEQMPDEWVVRVAVEGGGCVGYKYNLQFDDAENVDENDLVNEVEGLKIVVDKKSDLYLDGTKLDYYSDINKRGFVFDNPNSVRECGCKQSFEV